MKKKVPVVKIIGIGLAILYAISLLTFFQYIPIPFFKVNIFFFTILFAFLLISSLGVVTLREWGRQTIVIANAVMFVFLLIHFAAKVGLISFSYIFLTVIVGLYFSQSKIKLQFYRTNVGQWRSILVIDDDETTIKTIRPILMSYGYSVLTARTGEVGVDIARQQKPDLIILDVILPVLKGRDVCRILKSQQETKEIPVVFLTSKASSDDIQAELAMGGSAHLSKPIDQRALISTVRNILETKNKKNN